MIKLRYLIIALLLIALIGGVFWFFRNHRNNAEISRIDVETKSAVSISSSSKPEAPKEVKILFLGDMMLDRYIRGVAMKKGNDFILEKVKDLLGNNDLVVANLEGPITDKNSISMRTIVGEKGHFSFTMHPSWAKTLADNNIKLVNLGNNHIFNFEEGGLNDTKKYLSETGVEYFCEMGSRFKVSELNGWKIGFVCFNQFENNAEEKTLADIAEAKKQADLVVLYTHWGKEYETSILPNIRTLAQQFIDAGADLIIGSHPHVVEPNEIYKGKKIYYSLGNFVFDQYFSADTMKGLAVQVIISPDKYLNFQEYRVQMKNNGQTEINSPPLLP
jgi:poly-gamma-glutamate synthesis protein (capsule biosynthesis protein)